MIPNATLKRIDRAIDGAASSETRFTTGPARAIRCTVDKVTNSQRFTEGSVLAEAQQFLLVPIAEMQAVGEAEPEAGDRMVFAFDAFGSDQTGEIVEIIPRVHGPQSHFEVFLKKVF